VQHPFEQLDPAGYALPPELRAQLVSPALVVFMDAVRYNLRTMLAHVERPERWRPHVKTTKLPAVWSELLAVGVRHFKCATAREARHLLAAAADELSDGDALDVLLAHPRRGPELALMQALAAQHPAARLSVVVEAAEDVEHVPAALGVFADVDPGMHRTGLSAHEPERLLALAAAAGPRFRGVHYYDGHLHAGGPDRRRADAFACYDVLMGLLEHLDAAGLGVEEVITSGTPTFLQALRYEPLAARLARTGTAHRVSPGTVVFHDARSEEQNVGLGLRPAALVFTRVVSRPTPDVATCDAGSKSLAAEAGDPCAVVLGHPELEAMAPSEEHLPLRVRPGSSGGSNAASPPERGAELLLIPRHVCPTVNLADEALLVESDGSSRAAPVVARAHDLLTP
jgi:D-serine deaminase-like pyridoxal phosphate-dependent protein